MNIDLHNKLAIVTGGAGQLGRVMCRTLADGGADVVINYRSSASKAAELVSELQGKGVRALAVQADVTDPAAVLGMQSQVLAAIGKNPEIIVNYAVIIYQWSSIV